MNQKVRLYKYILLFVGLAKIVVLALSILLYDAQYKVVCEEMMELEIEKPDCKGDSCKKISLADWFESIYQFNFRKYINDDVCFKFVTTNEDFVQHFYPDVLTPPPNVLSTC
jgi:hypothetical protein